MTPRFLPALACLLLAFVVEAAAAPAELLTDHPLNGTLWDTRSGARSSERQLLAEAAEARWVLIGEKHDNATHHRLQARIVEALGSGGRRPAVVWEMAEPEHADALREARPETLDALGEALAWEARGWPAWREYRPIAEAALRHGLSMRPGKPARTMVRGVSRGEALPQNLAERLGWHQAYPPDVEAALLEELRQSHCGALPETALGGMLRVQRLWDAWMADSLLAAGGDGGILIAGSGHAREDRAVPWHLRQRGAGESLTVALVEVIAGRDAAGEYADFDEARFDYVWFTPRVDEDDPCAGLPRGPAQPD